VKNWSAAAGPAPSESSQRPIDLRLLHAPHDQLDGAHHAVLIVAKVDSPLRAAREVVVHPLAVVHRAVLAGERQIDGGAGNHDALRLDQVQYVPSAIVLRLANNSISILD